MRISAHGRTGLGRLPAGDGASADRGGGPGSENADDHVELQRGTSRAWRDEGVRLCVWVFLPVAATLSVTAALAARLGVPSGHLTRDPLAVAGAPPYFGLLSNVGVLLWAAAAAVCLFGAAAIARRGARQRSFLFASGALSGVLLVDDLFMLHESVMPAAFGVPEPAVLAAYGCAALAYLVAFRAELLHRRSVPLAAAFAWFAVSVGMDLGLPAAPSAQFAEDAAKLAGIASWCAFHVRTCAAAAGQAFAAARLEATAEAAARDADAVDALAREIDSMAALARSAHAVGVAPPVIASAERIRRAG